MFYADLHVHSKYSRATSRDCDLEHLYLWARKKGIAVVGTGDFTHPAWSAELREKLVPAEPGLFRLQPDLERAADAQLATAKTRETRFMLSVEISNIYKRDGKTRKVHNLIYAPDFATAERFSARLERIGNIRSDGRPILGLDSRDLLEITLESGDGAYLVPAHVWTPWFAVLGSKSGFDEVTACYADLAPHVFALETGLSSDPAMNWRLTQLDRYRLVSNSDAHSPQKLGREATAFDTELDYYALRRALETGNGFAGTVEFFPEEGKYHLDGHRSCGVCLTPDRSLESAGRCPVCSKPLTLGVLHRVEELADCADGRRPEGAAPFDCLVPLPEVLAETTGAGVASRKVQGAYERLVAKLGAELDILKQVPVEDIARSGSPLVAEAIARMRAGKVLRKAGYDGEYGVIRMFEEGELTGMGGRSLFGGLAPDEEEPRGAGQSGRGRSTEPDPVSASPDLLVNDPEPGVQLALTSRTAEAPASSILAGLDPDQAAAAGVVEGPLLIIAGPGTGKTRTLTHRIAHLVLERGVAPEAVLAIAFTRRAADELRERLAALIGERAAAIDVFTFHGLGAALVRAHAQQLGFAGPPRVLAEGERAALLRAALPLTAREALAMLQQISLCKRTRARPEPGSELEQAYAAYQRHLRAGAAVDFDDLIGLAVELLERDPELRALYARRYRYVSIDEYQDIDELQYRLVRLLVPEGGPICAIGDPDQAIYGFRGADVRFFVRFASDFPGARSVQLTRNYRSGPAIVEAALEVIAASSLAPGRRLTAQRGARRKLEVHEAATAEAEAEHIVSRIEQLIGGYDFHAIDSGRIESGDGHNLGFSDFAVLYRAARQLAPLEAAFQRAGIPFQRRSHARLLEDPLAQRLTAAVRASSRPTVSERLAEASALFAGAEAERLAEWLVTLRALAERAGTDAELFCTQLASGAEIDTWDPRAARVALLTLHAAKGLEFDTVFIAGCEEGLLPLRFGPQAAEDAEPGEPGEREAEAAQVDEERRLFFVGMTRARQRLVLTHARERLWQGVLRPRKPSPFLADIGARLVDASRESGTRKRAGKTQLNLF